MSQNDRLKALERYALYIAERDDIARILGEDDKCSGKNLKEEYLELCEGDE